MENKNKVSPWTKMKIVFATLLALFVLILIIQNWSAVEMSLVFKKYQVPLAIIIVISLFTGYIWGTISSYRSHRKSQRFMKDELTKLKKIATEAKK